MITHTIRQIFFLVIFFLLSSFLWRQPEKSRQFDFWIGTWDVNLKVLQSDLSWKSHAQAEAQIFRILNGKAILELWSAGEKSIIGQSIRYYNPEKDKWDLFLNWPGKERSGTGAMEGAFHHGRSEFFVERARDSIQTIERYTFSDISYERLRWDDGYSTDGGKTWRSNWIMEFHRTAASPPKPSDELFLHTYFSGNRCSGDNFTMLNKLAGKYRSDDMDLTVFYILDGCSLMGLSDGIYFKLTYNTYANKFELTFLDDEPQNDLWIYYGDLEGDTLVLAHSKNEVKAQAIIQCSDQPEFNVSYHGRDYYIKAR